MPRKITDITNEAVQELTIIYNDITANILLRYGPQTQEWFIDVSIGSKSALGVKLACGTTHIISRNMPIDFIVSDNSGEGIDPFKLDDFSTGRCSLIVLDDEDMSSIRDQEVPVDEQ